MTDVRISTLKNGYELKVNEEEFFYFNLEDLVEGFIFHVGLGIIQPSTKEHITDIINASLEWRHDKGKTTNEYVKMREENKSLKLKVENYKKRIKNLQTYNKKHGIYVDDDEENDDSE